MLLASAEETISFERLSAGARPRRRVLFVTNMWPDAERPYYGSFIASQAHSLPGQGVAVDVLYVRGYRGAEAYLAGLWRLPRRVGGVDYDVVHVHYGHTAAASLTLGIRPLVISFCGGDLLGEPRGSGITLKSRLEVGLFRQLARRADATITKSEEMQEALPAGIRDRNHVLPNGVDLERFSPRQRGAARERLGWPPEGKVVLFLGDTADPRKNVALARRACERLARVEPTVRLHEAWEVGADEVPVLMNAADCLVFPSLSEGSPNVVKEAMACELPIVSTAVGDVPERLAGVEGCYVREADPAAFAEGLGQALRTPRAPAARTAVAELGIDAVAVRLVEVYEEASRRRGQA